MATNLVSSAMQFLTPDLVAKIARTLDIDSEVAQSVVGAAVPAILASFAGLAAKPAGAQQLFDTLEQQGPDTPSQIASAIGGPDQKAIADTGSGLLSALLGGSELNTLVSAVSTFSGISRNAGKSVLGLLAPMVVGALGQQQRSGGLDASGLANLLSDRAVGQDQQPCRATSAEVAKGACLSGRSVDAGAQPALRSGAVEPADCRAGQADDRRVARKAEVVGTGPP